MTYRKKILLAFLGMLCNLITFSQPATLVFRNNPYFERYPLELYRESVYNLIGTPVIHPEDSLTFSLEISRPEGEYFRLWNTGSLLLFLKPGSRLLVDYVPRSPYRTTFEGDVAQENAWLNQKMFLAYGLLYQGRIDKTVSYKAFKRQVKQTADSLRQVIAGSSFSGIFAGDALVRLDFTERQTLLNYCESMALQMKQQLLPGEFEKWEKRCHGNFLKDVDKMLRVYREAEVLKYVQATRLLGDICHRIDSSFAFRAGYTLFDEQYRWACLKEDVSRLYGPNTGQFLQTIKDSSIRADVIRFLQENHHLLSGAEAMDFEFQDVDGNTLRLSDYKGQLLYIDVWATWCNPCKALAPAFHRLAGEYKDSGIKFISISIDKQRSVWIDYLKKQKHDSNVVELHSGNKSFAKAYRIAGIPRFILIGKDFKIRMAYARKPQEFSIKELKDRPD